MTRMKQSIGPALLVALALMLGAGCSDKATDSVETRLTLSPASLSFRAWAGQNPNPAQLTAVVRIDGQLNSIWTAATSSSWLRLGPEGAPTVYVSVISTNLPVGIYYDTVFFEAVRTGDNLAAILPVSLSVDNRLTVETDSLLFTGLAGGKSPDSVRIAIDDFAGVGAAYSAVSSAGWLTLGNAFSDSPDTLTIIPDITGLPSGQYRDSVVLTSVDLPEARAVIHCFLNLSSWEPVNFGSPGINLESIEFVGSVIGWTSGWLPSSASEPHGVVFRSINGGDSWAMVYDKVKARFGGLAAIDDSSCWVVGDSAYVGYTYDNGDSWTTITNLPVGRATNLTRVEFINHRYGWAVGREGVIIHTADSGSTWNLQLTPTDFALSGMQFLNDQTGWVVGDHGTILTTNNGGATWESRPLPSIIDLRGVWFADAMTGWVSGSGGLVARTIDGGHNWETLTTGVVSQLVDIQFATVTRGWAIGLNGVILFTFDGGTTWLQQLTGRTENLTSVFFADTHLGWVCGDNGTILRTANGGF